MSNRTKTRGTGVAATTAVVVALGIGVAGYNKATEQGPEDDVIERVTMIVTFEPKVRVTDVKIIVVCECVVAVKESTRRSPWERTITIPRGAKLTLSAEQRVRSKLSCAINGVIQESRDIPGVVICTHN